MPRSGVATASSRESLLLWLAHLLEVERDSRESPRIFLSYERLLHHWRHAVERISADLSITFPRLAHAQIEQLRHHAFTASEVEARPDVTKWVTDAFAALALEASEEERRQTFDAIRAEADRPNEAYGPVLVEARRERLGEERARLRAAADAREADLDERTPEAERFRAAITAYERELAERPAEAEHLRAAVRRART